MAVGRGFIKPTGILSSLRHSLIAGGAAGSHTLTGVRKGDALVQVLRRPEVGIESAISSGEAAAGTKAIDTGLGAGLSAYTVQVRTAGGANVPLSDAAISESAGVVTVADGAVTFNLVATDIVTVVAVGVPATEDLSSEFSITADDTLSNSGGTDTTGGVLEVLWYDEDWKDDYDADGAGFKRASY